VSLDEFRRSAEDYQAAFHRAFNWAAAPGLLFLFLGKLIACVFPAAIEADYGMAAVWIGSLACIAAGVISFFAVYFSLMWGVKEVRCPHCAEHLAAYRHFVIASGHCPLCGERVVESQEDDRLAAGSSTETGGEVPALTLAEYMTRQAAWQRSILWMVVSAVGVVVLVSGLGIGLTFYLDAVGFQPLGDATRPAFGITSLVLGIVSLFGTLWWFEARPKESLHCPGCGGELLTGIASLFVVSSHHCPSCGRWTVCESGRSHAERCRSALAQAERATLVSACHEHQGNRNRRNAAVVYGTMGMMMLLATIAALFVRCVDPLSVSGDTTPIVVYCIAVTSLFLALVVAYVWLTETYVGAAPQVRCAACSASLSEYAAVVTATGCCPTCGQSITAGSIRCDADVPS
jgi:uncharacterized protein (DUF983 family)